MHEDQQPIETKKLSQDDHQLDRKNDPKGDPETDNQDDLNNDHQDSATTDHKNDQHSVPRDESDMSDLKHDSSADQSKPVAKEEDTNDNK